MRTPAQVYRDVRQRQASKANAVTRDEQWWPDPPLWQPASPGAHREPLDLVPDATGAATPYQAGLTDDRSVDWGHFAGPGADAAREGEMGGELGASGQMHLSQMDWPSHDELLSREEAKVLADKAVRDARLAMDREAGQ